MTHPLNAPITAIEEQPLQRSGQVSETGVESVPPNALDLKELDPEVSDSGVSHLETSDPETFEPEEFDPEEFDPEDPDLIDGLDSGALNPAGQGVRELISTELSTAEIERDTLNLDHLSLEMPTIVLPNRVMDLEAIGLTDVGLQRQHNEDFFIVDNRVTHISDPDGIRAYTRGLYVLCDGMGGHDQGEVASRMAAETLATYFTEHWQDELPSQSELESAIRWTNQTLFALNENQTRLGSGRMGTTLILAMLQDTKLRFAHVGDSRLYRYTRSLGLEQLTVDHEVGQRAISRGIAPNIAYALPSAYQLTQALGPRNEEYINPEVTSLTLTEDTLLFLCSDGMTDNDVMERYQEDYLRPLLNFNEGLEAGVKRLIELGNAENGHDNITVVAIRAKLWSQRSPEESDIQSFEEQGFEFQESDS
jgi:protein phosphatase